MRSDDVFVVGGGMHPFGRHEGVSGLDMAEYALRGALTDAGVGWGDVDFAVGGSNVSGKPDSLVARLGLTGVPFTTVKNGCATGGVALATAVSALQSRRADLVAVVGFDKHERGAFAADPAAYGLGQWYAQTGMMITTQYFAMKTRRYQHEHGLSDMALARISARAFRNGADHPDAWRRTPWTEEEILAAAPVNDPLTQYMFCSPGEGGAAIVVASAAAARRLGAQQVRLLSVATRTRGFGSVEVFAPAIQGQGTPSSVSTDAARAAFEAAGVAPSEIDVAQLQDTESGAEIMHLAECGFCKDGEQEEWLARGATEIDGALPVNTDGGCLANGEPIGASGLRQVHEVVTQLRGTAGDRQVPNAPRIGFTHVYGAPGISACTVLSR